jgi:hypothetical protein
VQSKKLLQDKLQQLLPKVEFPSTGLLAMIAATCVSFALTCRYFEVTNRNIESRQSSNCVSIFFSSSSVTWCRFLSKTNGSSQ